MPAESLIATTSSARLEPSRPMDVVVKPLPISHIALELAREPDHPFGDRAHAYHLYLPLKSSGEIDVEGWRRSQQVCRVRRLRPNQPETSGRILQGPHGHWIFDYVDTCETDDRPGFRLDKERFVQGDCVLIREDDGNLHTFQVVSIRST
jgi:hypothetical protein